MAAAFRWEVGAGWPSAWAGGPSLWTWIKEWESRAAKQVPDSPPGTAGRRTRRRAPDGTADYPSELMSIELRFGSGRLREEVARIQGGMRSLHDILSEDLDWRGGYERVLTAMAGQAGRRDGVGHERVRERRRPEGVRRFDHRGILAVLEPADRLAEAPGAMVGVERHSVVALEPAADALGVSAGPVERVFQRGQPKTVQECLIVVFGEAVLPRRRRPRWWCRPTPRCRDCPASGGAAGWSHRPAGRRSAALPGRRRGPAGRCRRAAG